MGPRPGNPIREADVVQAAPEAEAELAVGFFGARYDRATSAERDYMLAMANLGAEHGSPASAPGALSQSVIRAVPDPRVWRSPRQRLRQHWVVNLSHSARPGTV